MARWFLEPGHTAAEFCARHMMVTYVRGHFKNIHGQLNFDPANPKRSTVEIEIDARGRESRIATRICAALISSMSSTSPPSPFAAAK